MKLVKSKKLKVVAAIQARIRSSRFPGKVLQKIGDKTMIEQVSRRLRACREVDEIVLAIPDNPENDVLAEHAESAGIPYCRGSESDLISRHLKALKQFRGDALVRVTADCPLVEPAVVDELVRIFRQNLNDFDLLTNSFPATFPHGLEVEILPLSALKRLDREVKDGLHREWLTCYIMENERLFRIYNLEHKPNLSRLRWTVDYPEDLSFVREVFQALDRPNRAFTMAEVLSFVQKNPRIAQINAQRKEKPLLSGLDNLDYQQLKKSKKL